jgi:hypothetical protein
VSSARAPTGEQGQVNFVSGKRLSMRLWWKEESVQDKLSAKHEHAVVRFMLAGRERRWTKLREWLAAA